MRFGGSNKKKDNSASGDARILGSSQRLEPVGLVIFFALAFLATYLVRDHVFFWDTVQLGSKHAHFYYETGFTQLLLPPEFDSGHPPTFGLYLAMMGTIFGKTLPVSHFAMLPFLFGIIYFLWQLGKYLAGERNAVFLILLAIADPTLAAQCVLVSPDVVLTCFFLMGVFAILQDRNILKIVAMLGLAMISMRGMMTVAALFVFEITIHFKTGRNLPKLVLQRIFAYSPAGIFGLTFLIWHYTQTGWIGYHSDSPWASSFAKVNASGFLKNIAILGWRMLDFGRVFVWLVLLIILFQKRNFRQWWKQEKFRQIFILLLICTIILCSTLLVYQGLNGHRYLLPIFLSLTLLCFTAIFKIQTKKIAQYLSILIIFLGLLTGNFWIYPDKIAQGWDSTLAHLPYYKVRTEMLDFIQTKNLPLDSIGTAFPEVGPLKYRDLSGRVEGFQQKDLSAQSYILYSNVMNDFTDAEIDRLQHWTTIKTFERRGVWMTLYRIRKP